MGTPTVITRRAHLNKLMNFLCFASATATFLWHFLLPYRLNIDTDRPKKRKEEMGGRGGGGSIAREIEISWSCHIARFI